MTFLGIIQEKEYNFLALVRENCHVFLCNASLTRVCHGNKPPKTHKNQALPTTPEARLNGGFLEAGILKVFLYLCTAGLQ